MKAKLFGATGIEVAVIGQGTWHLDGGDDSSAIASLCKGLDLGLTHIDTAEMYGSGAAEALVGKAIAGRRDEVFLVSKVLPESASAAGTRAACERSLRALQTDRLDCYLLHWRGRHPLAETITAFERLKVEGKILSWGVSNFDVDDLEEALTVAGSRNMACNQVLYHLGQRAIEHEVAPWCRAHGVTIVAYSPFGQDAFPAPHSSGGRVLASIAAARGATSRQVALAFVTRDPHVLAIPKASRSAHVVENAAAGDLNLSVDEIRRLDIAFPRGALPRGLPML